MTERVITNRSGSVLYIAEGAADVRAAVEAAVKARADLTDANLTRADLTRANLMGADLTDANLTRADLTDANLTRADLTDANLMGADLTGANLTRANLTGANLMGANLTDAYLTDANLMGADLTGANLTRANLTDANLTRADLTGANLMGANLTDAYLTRANGINPYRVNPLLMLRDQPGTIVAYKLVDDAYRSPIQTTGKLTYHLGAVIKVPNADTDETTQCSRGVNLATLPWCMAHWRPGYRILRMKFTAADIAAIPIGDGKFRVRRATVLAEVDLVVIGLVEANLPAAAPAKKRRKVAP
jgi:hypothetical protein